MEVWNKPQLNEYMNKEIKQKKQNRDRKITAYNNNHYDLRKRKTSNLIGLPPNTL